ncbi:MAG: MarC family protein [Candidatus Endonucleobacter sp. (ex Gigantidas childressi)]|nr:MarC family protein [Candidatus Endonucleobacter sp. (ex Gigantidas childressi)]
MEKLIKDLIILWSTIDPVGTLALFTALTAKLTPTQRYKTAIKATCYAFLILFSALMIGQVLLKAMDIQMISLQLAGGVILFLFGLQMIFTNPAYTSDGEEPGHELAVFPLAIPSIASPGAIMAVIVSSDNQVYDITQQAMTTGVLFFVLLTTCCLMLLSNSIFRVLGHNGSAIIVRVMGMILAALSVEMIMTAIGVSHWMKL